MGVRAKAIDPDGDALTYTLTNDAGGRFAIDPITGVVTVNNASLLDGPDSHTITILTTDPQGASSTVDVSIDVFNVNPTAVNDSATVNEAGPAINIDVLNNDTDPAGINDPLTIDGINTVGTAGSVSFTGTEVTYDPNGQFEYLAAGETATDRFTYAISDGDGGFATATVNITIIGANSAPEITLLNSSNGNLEHKSDDGDVSINGSFTDVDLSDEHAVTVDWGDGTMGDLSVEQLLDTFAGDHHYIDGGIYTITVTIDDGNGGTDTLTSSAVVKGVGVVDGTLYIIGTDGRDHVNLKLKSNDNELEVDAKFNQGSDGGDDRNKQTYTASDIDQVVTFLCDGDDHYNGSVGGPDMTISQTVFGGDGDDDIKGGDGHDALFGGSGKDKLQGKDGDDILVGGDGRDDLKGGDGDDLLIGGILGELDFTDVSIIDTIDAAMAAWTTGDWSSAFDWLGNVDDDNDKDDLKGEKGNDYLIGGVDDKLKD